MEVQVLGQVGPVAAKSSDGSKLTVRQGSTGEQVITQLHGRYFEQAQRGGLYIASTAVAGVAPGTALSTTPPLTIWNPPNSGILVALLQLWLGYVSGTLGAGTIVHAQNPSQATAPSSGTGLTPVAGKLNSAAGIAKVYQGSTISATPTIVRPAFVMGAGLATTASLPVAPAVDLVDGQIVIPPGAAWCTQGVAAGGTSPLVLLGAVYEEVAA